MSRQAILQTAKAELGTKENPPNSNKTKYGAWYGFDGFAWCAMFVSWVYHKSGHPLGKIDDPKGFRSCQSGYNHFKSTGEITKDPQPGDIVLFDWNGDSHCDHVGIFEKWINPGSSFSSFEGNTAVGNDSDGGCVMQRTRNTQNVKAFVSPKVLGNEVAPAAGNDPIKKGDKGADVAEIQKLLFDLGYSIVVDGYFGPQTGSIIKQFQKENKFPVDGIASPALIGQLQQALDKKEAADSKVTTGSFLQKGATGAAVVALQKALNKKSGKKVVDEDGVFGNGTFAALKKFQTTAGLTADGIAGPQTFKALGIKNV